MRGRRGGGLLRRVGGPRWLLPLGMALLAAPALGQGSVTELLVYQTGGAIRAEVRAHDLLDERTTQTIESGFPGVCLYVLRLEDRSGRLVAERQVERSLRYEPWQDCYLLTSDGDVLALPTLAAADSAISCLANCDLCSTSRLGPTEEYQVSLQIAVQPLASDRGEGLFGPVSGRAAEPDGVALDLQALFGRTAQEKSASGQLIGRSSPFFRAADLREAP
jgi:hypothetical protein